ncbi:MAG: hypothetical protein R3B45_17760 [Bdellovibrionota bacterium]
MMRYIYILLLFGFNSMEAFAFPGQDDQTVGYDALKFSKKADYWTRLDLTAVDGSIRTSPPDATKYDRKLEVFSSLGTNIIFSPVLSLRPNLKANWMMNKEEEKSPPKSPIERTIYTFAPSVDLTYINNKGLELLLGVSLFSVGAYKEEQTSETADSNTKFDSVHMVLPRFSIVKRAGFWDGGFYFIKGEQSKRTFDKVASDGSSISGKESVAVPSELGLAVRFAFTTMDLNMDFATIQASEGSMKSANGIGIKDDYLRLKVSGFYDLSGRGVKLKLGYNTLSYSDNSFMSIDTIPIFSSQLLYIHGDKENHLYLGLVYGYGKDGQSIPEFNAEYKFHAFGLTMGLNLPTK